MSEEERIYELACAALSLAHALEGSTCDSESLDQVRAYLATFPIGQNVLAKDAEPGSYITPQWLQ